MKAFVVATLALLTLSSGAPAAVAADEDPAPPLRTEIRSDWAFAPVDGGWALPLEHLGWGPALVATTAEPTIIVEIPQVAGLLASRFEGALELSDHVVSAEVRVLAQGEELSVLALEGGERVDLVVDLPPDTTELSIEVDAASPSECALHERADLARVRDGALLFSGTPTVATALSEVLPIALGAVEFVVPPESSPGVDQAVVAIGARLAARYPGSLQVVVTDHPSSGALRPFLLAIEVDESPETGLELTPQGRLRISGVGTELQRQLDALDGDLLTLAATTSVTVAPDGEGPKTGVTVDRRSEEVPLSDVPGASLATSEARHLVVGVELRQAFFGGAVGSYTVRLGGLATPPPGEASGDVQLALRIDDELIDVVPVGRDGRFDTQFDIKSDQVGPTNLVQLTLDGVEACASSSRYAIQIDRGSWVRADVGEALPPGFDRFPQAAGEGLAVYPGRGLAQLATAAQIVGMLQDESPQPIETLVVDRSELLSVEMPAVVVGPDAELLLDLGAPVSKEAGEITSGDTHVVGADGLEGTSTLQAFTAATSGSDVIVVDLAPRVSAEGVEPAGLPVQLAELGWSSLHGQVVQLDADGAPRGVDIDAVTPSESAGALAPLAPLDAPRQESPRRSFVDGLVIALGASLVVMAGLRLSRRLHLFA